MDSRDANSSETTNVPVNPSSDSVFSHVPRAPEIPIYAVMTACSKDPSPLKLNLGMGVYRTEDGKPLLLNVVRRAEEILVNDRTAVKEYLPITGLPEFNKLSSILIFGAEKDVVYIPEPTYSNHPNFFIAAGLTLRKYRYYNPQTQGLDFQCSVIIAP
ncbi:hypothetical protein CRG98_018915 [Punica granatum]|uniref:Aminotransferase class I/classII large domain-containing protein n=1 Tax=Punica granatum TaxID=22663 RepID=A0A2I0JWG5_PUNGR|nr:hypothetical protein CRG98_018915 [Punica granatum]